MHYSIIFISCQLLHFYLSFLPNQSNDFYTQTTINYADKDGFYIRTLLSGAYGMLPYGVKGGAASQHINVTKYRRAGGGTVAI